MKPAAQDLLNCERRARSYAGCAVIVATLFLGGCFSALTLLVVVPDWRAKLTGIFLGTVGVFVLLACISHILSFLKNERWQYGIRDDVIWWDSPYWPRSTGFIPLDTVCKLIIHAGTGKLLITMLDGSTKRIPWNAYYPAEEQLRDVLIQHYPSVAIEFTERNEGSA
jgi:hypothetical protein